MIMELARICRFFGYSAETETMLRNCGWNEADERSSETPEFLTIAFQEKYYPQTRCRIDAMPAIRRISAIAEQNPEVRTLARYLSRIYLHTRDNNTPDALPLPEKVFGDDAGVLFLMVATAAIPMIEATHRRYGIPEHYAADSASWIGGSSLLFNQSHGNLPGFLLNQIRWLRCSIDGTLFRIGRLEFKMTTVPSHVPAIYRNAEGRTLLLCGDGWFLNKDGLRVRMDSPDAAFKTTLDHIDGSVTGTPISPLGVALPGKTVTLSDSEWKPLISPWETILEIHIPGGGGMTPERLRDSLNQALAFFRSFFHKEIRLFTCNSWILNPEWEKRLPKSNIAAFLREGYLYPHEIGDGRDGLFFLFGRMDGDPLSYPADNSMRRAMLDVLREGGILKRGGMVLPAADLKFFGTQHYRKQQGKP